MGRLAVDLRLVFFRYAVCCLFWTLLATVVDAEDKHRSDGQPRCHDENRIKSVYLFGVPLPSLYVHALVTQHHTTCAVLLPDDGNGDPASAQILSSSVEQEMRANGLPGLSRSAGNANVKGTVVSSKTSAESAKGDGFVISFPNYVLRT